MAWSSTSSTTPIRKGEGAWSRDAISITSTPTSTSTSSSSNSTSNSSISSFPPLSNNPTSKSKNKNNPYAKKSLNVYPSREKVIRERERERLEFESELELETNPFDPSTFNSNPNSRFSTFSHSNGEIHLPESRRDDEDDEEDQDGFQSNSPATVSRITFLDKRRLQDSNHISWDPLGNSLATKGPQIYQRHNINHVKSSKSKGKSKEVSIHDDQRFPSVQDTSFGLRDGNRNGNGYHILTISSLDLEIQSIQDQVGEIQARLKDVDRLCASKSSSFEDLSSASSSSSSTSHLALTQESLLKSLNDCERELKLISIEQRILNSSLEKQEESSISKTKSDQETSREGNKIAFERLNHLTLFNFGSVEGLLKSFGRESGENAGSKSQTESKTQYHFDRLKLKSILDLFSSLPSNQIEWLRPLIFTSIERFYLNETFKILKQKLAHFETEKEQEDRVDEGKVFEGEERNRLQIVAEACLMYLEVLALPILFTQSQSQIMQSITSQTLNLLSLLLEFEPQLSNHLIKLLINSDPSKGYPKERFKTLIDRILTCMGKEYSSCLKLEESKRIEHQKKMKEYERSFKEKGKGKRKSFDEDFHRIPFHCQSKILKNSAKVLELFWNSNCSSRKSNLEIERKVIIREEMKQFSSSKESFIPRLETLNDSDFYFVISDLDFEIIRKDLKLKEEIEEEFRRKETSNLKNEKKKLNQSRGYLRDLDSKEDLFHLDSYPFLLTLGTKSKLLNDSIKRVLELNERKREDLRWSGMEFDEKSSKNIRRIIYSEEENEDDDDEMFQNSNSNNNGNGYEVSRDMNGKLIIEVRREEMVSDSIKELKKHFNRNFSYALKFDLKELEIKFSNEDGLDNGGLKNEWFGLLAEALSKIQIISSNSNLSVAIDDQDGMDKVIENQEDQSLINERKESDSESLFFKDLEENQGTAMPYINPEAKNEASMEKYNLLGSLMALALVHHQLLGIELPEILFDFIFEFNHQAEQEKFTEENQVKRVYRNVQEEGTEKLFYIKSCSKGLARLHQISPSISKSLSKILEWEEEVDEPSAPEIQFQKVFDLTWIWNRKEKCTKKENGKEEWFELIPDGENIQVTLSNRQDYILSILNYLLIDSVSNQLKEIKKGFNLILPLNQFSNPIIKSVNSFSSFEFSQLFLGSIEPLPIEQIKFQSTLSNFKLNDSKDFKLVNSFWNFFSDLNQDDQREFWRFITGLNRLPVIGNGISIQLVAIGDWNDEIKRLPSSSTCTNTIFLPRNKGGDLTEDLRLAFKGSRGFGLK